jgi:hypothetical protein
MALTNELAGMENEGWTIANGYINIHSCNT